MTNYELKQKLEAIATELEAYADSHAIDHQAVRSRWQRWTQRRWRRLARHNGKLQLWRTTATSLREAATAL